MQIAQISGTAPSILGTVPCHGNPWICVWTGPNQETRAARHLVNQGIPHLAPRHEVRLPNRSKRIEPLFRRYIFAQPEDGRIPGELKPNGIAAILRWANGQLKIMPEWAIEEIVLRQDERGVIRPEPYIQICPGQSVRVIDGPFTGFPGICQLDEDGRVSLLMTIFGRSQPIQLAREQLEVA